MSHKMTDVSKSELEQVTGGLSFQVISQLRRTHNLNAMQVSALANINQLLPIGFDCGVPGAPAPDLGQIRF